LSESKVLIGRTLVGCRHILSIVKETGREVVTREGMIVFTDAGVAPLPKA